MLNGNYDDRQAWHFMTNLGVCLCLRCFDTDVSKDIRPVKYMSVDVLVVVI